MTRLTDTELARLPIDQRLKKQVEQERADAEHLRGAAEKASGVQAGLFAKMAEDGDKRAAGYGDQLTAFYKAQGIDTPEAKEHRLAEFDKVQELGKLSAENEALKKQLMELKAEKFDAMTGGEAA